MFRQGDVLIRKVDGIPDGASRKDCSKEGRIVLAYGEVTGHAHALNISHATLYSEAGRRYLEIKERTSVVHEEHSPIELLPGIYEVIQQREYTPQATRNVAD